MKKQIVIGLSLLLFGFVQAQQTENYIHFNLGGGSQSFRYNLINGTAKGQLGYTLDVGYSHFFNPEWGLSLGLGAHSLSSLSTLNYQSVTPNQVDVVGDSYEFRANYKNWQEKQQGVFLDIPLAVQYRHFLSGKFGLLASAGAKISIPVRASYKTVGGEIVTTGYYSKWNALLHDLPRYGFSTYTASYTGNLSLLPVYVGIVDFGGLYKLSPKVDVYLGGYLNYGLNSIITRGSKLVYEPDGTYNSFFGSDQIKKVIPIAFGIKAGLYWKVKERKSAIRLDNEFTRAVSQAPDTKSPNSKGLYTKMPDIIPVSKLNNKQDIKSDTTQLDNEFTRDVSQAPDTKKLNSKGLDTKMLDIIPVSKLNNKQDIKSDTTQLDNELARDVYQTPDTKSPNSKGLYTKMSDIIPVNKLNNKQDVKSDTAQLAVQVSDVVEQANRIARSLNLKFDFNTTIHDFFVELPKINALAELLKANPGLNLLIMGHTCDIGTQATNMELGLKRALFVKQLLIKRGVPTAQMKAASKGLYDPLVPNTSEANRAKNRRVEIWAL